MISRPFTPLLVATLLAFAGYSLAAGEDLKDVNRLYQQGQTQQALEQVNAYLASKPKDAQARFLKGVILTDLKRNDEAIKVFTELTEEYPELPEPYNNLAVLYASLGQYERAKIALELAIRTHPSYATAHENLGDIYAQLASRAYDKALQLDVTNTTAQTKLAMIKELFGGKAIRSAIKPSLAKVEPAKPPAVATVTEEPARPADTKGTKPASSSENPEIVSTLEAWAKAWSEKNASAYLSFYAPDFKTPNGESRDTWESQRKERLRSAKFIHVNVSRAKVSMSSDDEATVVFHQDYKSNTLKSSGRKTLHLVKSNDKWLIKSEKSGG
jgi:tetratricopeptide (TPR) repeat protein